MPKDLTLSPSGIKMYQECPYSFYLRYIEKRKPVITDDSALKLGKSVHAVLENYYKNIDLNTTTPETELVTALQKTAQTHWDRSIDNRKRDEMNTHMFLWLQFEIQRFKRYKDAGKLDIFCPVTVEEDITDYPNRLRAIIDKRCIGMNGSMYAMDYKTDKSLPALRNFKNDLKLIDDKYKIQAALNAMVLKTKDIKLDNFFFQFIRYSDKLLSVPLTTELFNEIDALIKKIRESTEFPKNPKGCFFCGMRVYCKTEEKSIHCLSENIL